MSERVVELPRQSPAEFERTPPQDIPAEQSVLGGMLLSKDAIADVVEVLRAGDFYRPAHQTIYDTILDLYGRGEPADPITVSGELTRSGELARIGGAPYLHTLLSSVPTAANAGYYARIVAERAVLRRLVEAGTRIVQLGYAADGGEVDELVDRAQQAVYDVTERRTSEDYTVLADVMQPAMDEMEAISSRAGTMTGVPTGFTDLDTLTNGLHPGQLIVVAGRPGLGKALALDTPLPTPTGWTTMGEVRVGDELVGADGCPTKVVAATGVLSGRPCYEVLFSDGTSLVADAQHQWVTETRADRRRWGARLPHRESRGDVRTTQEIAETLLCAASDGRRNHSVRNAAPLQAPEADLPLPPYALGVWLGDGHSAGPRFTSDDPEIALGIEAEGLVVRPTSSGRTYSMLLPVAGPTPRSCAVCGTSFIPQTSQVQTCGRSCGPRIRGAGRVAFCSSCGGPSAGLHQCRCCRTLSGTTTARLRGLGVLNDKHVPAAYLRASEAQRRALLAGLLDTDGTVLPSGNVQFAVTNRRLAASAYELVVSLGYRCGWSEKPVRGRSERSSTAFVLTFTTADEVFRLPRKALLLKERYRGSLARTGRRFITAVTPVRSVPVRCVQVDAPDALYLAAKGMVPTHNSTLGLDIARSCSVKHRLTSAIFSLEMTKTEITMRLLSAEARIGLHHMRTGTMSDDDWARLARRMGEVADAPLFIDDSPNLSMMEIRAKARRLKQRHDLRLVIIDYLQLMSGNKKAESRQQEVSELSRSLKLLAKELGVPVIAMSQLNRASEQRTDKKPQLADLRESGCLTADTTLLRADTGAPVSFAELMRDGHQGVAVWSLDEQRRLVAAPVVNVFASGVKEVFRLRLASGREVKASGNHRFLTGLGWRALDALSVGDRVAVPRRLPAPRGAGLGWSEHRLGLLAHLIGDGCVVARQPVHYTSQDEANLGFVEAAAAAEFGITSRRVVQQTWQHTYLPSPYRLTHGRRNPISQWFHDLGIADLRSCEKRVPDALFRASDDEVAVFLRHLWATDGNITVASEQAAVTADKAYYASSSRRLADDVLLLLSRLGVAARIKVARKAGHRDGYHVTVADSRSLRTFCQRIGVHGTRGRTAQRLAVALVGRSSNTNVDTLPFQVWETVKAERLRAGVSERQLQSAINTRYCGSALYKSGLSRDRLLRIADALQSDVLRGHATDDVLWDRVVAVEPLGPQPVYDATVEGTHNFIADGVVAHNSIEQDADMVVLLYREDAFEKESPRAGEADLIVAKHRNGPTSTITVASQLHYSRFVDMSTG